MAKTKTKGTAKTVSDTPVPQPITISSTNPKIMADNIKKLEKAIKGADDASEISYDNTESHLTASNVQAAIDEIAPALSPAAEDVSYDNTDSGLTADNVQSAIDEVLSSLGGKLSLTDVIQFKVQITAQYIILAAITNVTNSDGYHIYFSATTTKGIQVYKREDGVSTLLYSFT